MKTLLRLAGRTFQLAGLITLPSAIWVAEINRSEKGAVAIFLGSLLVFFMGYLLTRASARI